VEGSEPIDESGLLSGARLYLVFLSLMLAVLRHIPAGFEID